MEGTGVKVRIVLVPGDRGLFVAGGFGTEVPHGVASNVWPDELLHHV